MKVRFQRDQLKGQKVTVVVLDDEKIGYYMPHLGGYKAISLITGQRLISYLEAYSEETAVRFIMDQNAGIYW